jgi:hypothetical protein
LLCSNCGYDNPREHRYCGMCGTPFPYRALTVPEAQSTLVFSSAPLEVATEPPPQVAEPVAPQLVESSLAAAEELVPVAEVEAVGPHAPVTEVPVDEPVLPELTRPEPAPSETLEEVPAEVAEAVSHAPEKVAEVAPEEPPQVEAVTEEPATVATDAPVPVAPEVVEPPQPVAIEAEPEEAAIAAEPVIEQPTEEVRRPASRVVVMPTPRSYPPPETSAPPVAKPIAPHPSPDIERFTPPPASAGMPTFQQVSAAAGPPTISPFEPPTEAHTDQDRELQEFVASFRYTPPAETADELTMRSEAPVIDEEAPAEFHHPSFDDDVPPPPEAGPHPTGQEYYSSKGTTERPHFLELSDTPAAPADEGASPAILGGEVPPASGSKRWLWTTIAALVVLCGGLGFWEGRAQSTHAFRGPLELAHDVYDRLRQQLAEINKPAALVPESHAPDRATQPEVKPSQAEAPSTENAQPDSAARPSQPTETPAQPTNQDQATSKPTDTEAKPAASTAAKEEEVAKSAPPKPIEVPPASKPSAKPQPGQQELDKAQNASDATAAAAWLWKATSRGNPEAPVRLADMYIKGNGVPRSCEQAMVLLRSAATKENAPARNRLAALYANGTCVARDRVKAYQLMSSALEADPSSDWAKQNREQLWNQMTPQERAEAQKYR